MLVAVRWGKSQRVRLPLQRVESRRSINRVGERSTRNSLVATLNEVETFFISAFIMLAKS